MGKEQDEFWSLWRARQTGITVGWALGALYGFTAIFAHSFGCPAPWYVHPLIAVTAFFWGPIVIAPLVRLFDLLKRLFGKNLYSRFVRFWLVTVGGLKDED